MPRWLIRKCAGKSAGIGIAGKLEEDTFVQLDCVVDVLVNVKRCIRARMSRTWYPETSKSDCQAKGICLPVCRVPLSNILHSLCILFAGFKTPWHAPALL